MDKSVAKKKSNMYLMCMLFIIAMLLAHLAACAWISLGIYRHGGWISKLKYHPFDQGGDE